MTADPDKPQWTDVRKRIVQIGENNLITLVKDLYDLSSENQRFLHARFLQRGPQAPGILADYKEKITICFFGRGDHPTGNPRLGDARKLIRDYRKATQDSLGSLDLMLHYVETGTRFTNSYGDIDEPFYNSLISVLNGFYQDLFKSPDPQAIYQRFGDRLGRLRNAAARIGWGYGDTVEEILSGMEMQFAEDED